MIHTCMMNAPYTPSQQTCIMLTTKCHFNSCFFCIYFLYFFLDISVGVCCTIVYCTQSCLCNKQSVSQRNGFPSYSVAIGSFFALFVLALFLYVLIPCFSYNSLSDQSCGSLRGAGRRLSSGIFIYSYQSFSLFASSIYFKYSALLFRVIHPDSTSCYMAEFCSIIYIICYCLYCVLNSC